MSTIQLKCACGQVQGEAVDVTPTSGNRLICCCSDCQAFAHYLSEQSLSEKSVSEQGLSEQATDGQGQQQPVLDSFGGTELVQMSQAQITIHQGQENLRALRLTKKGLLRWYTSCCNTPVANTINAKVAFAGVIHSFTDIPDRDAVLGPIKSVIQTQHAIGEPNYPQHSAKFPIGVTAGLIFKMLVWKIQGKQSPSVFFGEDGRPVVKPVVVSDGASV